MVKVKFEFETFDLQECRCQEPDIMFWGVYESDDDEKSYEINDSENVEFDTDTYTDCVIVKGILEIEAEKSDLEGKDLCLSVEGSWDNSTTDLDGGFKIVEFL